MNSPVMMAAAQATGTQLVAVGIAVIRSAFPEQVEVENISCREYCPTAAERRVRRRSVAFISTDKNKLWEHGFPGQDPAWETPGTDGIQLICTPLTFAVGRNRLASMRKHEHIF